MKQLSMLYQSKEECSNCHTPMHTDGKDYWCLNSGCKESINYNEDKPKEKDEPSSKQSE